MELLLESDLTTMLVLLTHVCKRRGSEMTESFLAVPLLYDKLPGKLMKLTEK